MKQRIMEDLIQAMKDRDALAKATLQVLKSRLDSSEKEKGRELTEDEQIAIVQSEIKQTQQTLEAAEKASHSALIEKETARIKLLEAFLPEQLTEAEALEILTAKSINGLSMKDAMVIARTELNGKIDNATIAKLVKHLISN